MATRRRTRRCRPVAGLVALVVAASGPTAGAQDEDRPRAVDATVAGVVVDGDGRPLPGVPITVIETDTGMGNLFGPLFGLFTLGFGCLTGICTVDDSETVDQTETAADGSYSATLPRAYVAGTETDMDWFVRASLPATGNQRSGASSAFEFETNIELQAAPPLPVWGHDPVVTVDGWGVSIDVGPAPRSLSDVRVALGSPADTLALPGTRATFDARLLESPSDQGTELAANGSASADVRVPHANGRTIYHQRTTTAVLPVDLITVPASRNAPCTAHTADGAEVQVSSGSPPVCPLTDGELTDSLSRAVSFANPTDAGPDPSNTTTTVQPVVSDAVLDLLAPVDASLIVLRGVGAGPVVDLSLDGVTWSTVRTSSPASVSTLMAVAAPPPGTQARFVRVRAPQGLSTATEVSVWTPRPVPLPAPPAGDPGAAPPVTTETGELVSPAPDPASAAGDGLHGAELLAIVAAGGAWWGVVAARRRRSAVALPVAGRQRPLSALPPPPAPPPPQVPPK